MEGDFKLGESNAILKYLAETHPSVPASLWPAEAKERAYVDQLLEWIQNHLRPALISPIRARLIAFRNGEKADEESLAFLE